MKLIFKIFAVPLILLIIYIFIQPQGEVIEDSKEIFNHALDSNLNTNEYKENLFIQKNLHQEASDKQGKNTKLEVIKKNKCIPWDDVYKNPINVIVENWMFENFGVDQVDYANYLNEQELLDLANGGDVRAMFVLGENYRWHSTMDTFQSTFIRPRELPKIKFEVLPLNNEIMAKSRYWFKQAALNGHMGGIEGLFLTYYKEIEELDKDPIKNTEKIRNLNFTLRAYYALSSRLVPELEHTNKNISIENLSVEERSLYDKVLHQLMADWDENRKQLGFTPEINLDIPAEYYKRNELMDNVCDTD